MYPVERYMKVLKSYTKNQYWPEASIVERYVTEEAIEFCFEYIKNAAPVGLPETRHDKSRQGRDTRGFNVVTMDQKQVSQVHLYVLNNTAEVIPYIDAHKEYVAACHPNMNMMRVLQEHNRSFINWFRKTIFANDSCSKTLSLLAVGPNLNSGVSIDAHSDQLFLLHKVTGRKKYHSK